MCTRVQLSANRVSINEMVVRGRDDAIPAAYEHWDIIFFQYKFEDLIRALFHRQMQIFLLCDISCIPIYFFFLLQSLFSLVIDLN